MLYHVEQLMLGQYFALINKYLFAIHLLSQNIIKTFFYILGEIKRQRSQKKNLTFDGLFSLEKVIKL